MILAAGRGERMRPLTDHLPKPLLQVGGQPLIVHLLKRLQAAGLTDIIINLAWQGAKLRDALGDGRRLGVHIRYSEEGEQGLETGGGIHHALPLLGEQAFAVVNGDIWTDYSFNHLRLAPDRLAHLVLVDNPAHHPHGDFCYAHGEASHDSGPRLTFSGIGIYHPMLFADCSPGTFKLAPLLCRAISAGLVSAEYYKGSWWDVGTPQRLAALEAHLNQA